MTAGNTATNDINLTGSINTTNLVASNSVNSGTITSSGLITAGSVTSSGLITGGSGSILNTLSATDLTATAVVTGYTLTALNNVNAVGVIASGTVTGGTVTSTGTVNGNRASIAINVDTPSISLTSINPLLNQKISISGIRSFADDATAKAASPNPLVAGDVYITDGTGAAPLNIAGILMVVV